MEEEIGVDSERKLFCGKVISYHVTKSQERKKEGVSRLERN